jgi:polar amino acid transport system substrate-binding protein
MCVHTVRWSSNLAKVQRNADGISPSQDSDIAQEVLRRMGCKAKFIDLPWARALVELELGRLDVLPGAFVKPERQKYAYFSRPYLRSTNILFIRSTLVAKYPFRNLTDIMESDFRLGVQIGVSYGPAFDAMRKHPQFQARLVELSARERAWKMLQLGRIDGLVADAYIGGTELRDLGFGAVAVPTDLVITEEPSTFALSKRNLNETFVRVFDAALESMMSDGTYKKIRERYETCQISATKLACK